MLGNKIVLLIGLMSIALVGKAFEGKDLTELGETSLRELAFQNNLHEKTWKMSRANATNLDQGTGTITWQFADGVVVEAAVQIIGTYNHATNTFLWSWGNHSILKSLQKSAEIMRSFGELHGIETLTYSTVRISEREAWKLTAIANHLGESSGAYRANVGGPTIYVTFGKVRLR